jgi:hypothetical protein
LPVGLNAAIEYSKTIILSSKVKDMHLLSGILISHVDTGKSETLMQLHGNKGAVVLCDATSYGIAKNLISEIAKGQIHHIIIPDFLKIMERSRRVASELVSLLNSMAEEGFTGALTYNLQILTDKPLHCGFLTSITLDRYHRVKSGWSQIGFSSRIIPLFFGYEQEDREKAAKDILYERKVFDKINLPEIEPTSVDVEDKHREEVGRIADFTAAVNKDFTAFRTKRNMLGFVKSHALVRGENKVGDEDLKFLRSLVPFWFDPIFGNDCDYQIIRQLPATAAELVQTLEDIYSQATIYRRLKELEQRRVLTKRNEAWTTTF